MIVPFSFKIKLSKQGKSIIRKNIPFVKFYKSILVNQESHYHFWSDEYYTCTKFWVRLTNLCIWFNAYMLGLRYIVHNGSRTIFYLERREDEKKHKIIWMKSSTLYTPAKSYMVTGWKIKKNRRKLNEKRLINKLHIFVP